MLATIIEFLVGLFKAIPILNKWFTKTPTQKIEEDKKALDEIEKALNKTARPTWEE